MSSHETVIYNGRKTALKTWVSVKSKIMHLTLIHISAVTMIPKCTQYKYTIEK